MKVRIIEDRCQGHGMCALYCPRVFTLNDEDGHGIVLDENVPDDLKEDVLLAQKSCPEEAIDIFDVEG